MKLSQNISDLHLIRETKIYMLSMHDSVFYSVAFSSSFLLLYGVVRVSYTIWWKPKLLERRIKCQGIRGSPYKPLIGDMKEFVRSITEAWSKPISLAHQIVPRVDPFTINIVQKYGLFLTCIFNSCMHFKHATI